MDKAAFATAFSEWLEKSQDHLIKTDWEPIGRSYPFIELKPDSATFTPFNKKLKFCRVCVVTGAALYLKEKQEPYNVTAFDGDFSFRAVPKHIFPDDIESSHEYTAVHYSKQDINVLFPLERLRQLEQEEVIGELSESNFSIYDFAPNASRLGEELAEPMAQALVDQEIDVALFFPVCELGHQTMALVQSEAERRGIATLCFTTNKKVIQTTRPPRSVVADFPGGAPLGEPNNVAMQNSLLSEGFKFLKECREPGAIFDSGRTWHDPFI